MKVVNKYHSRGVIPRGAINIMRGTIFGNPYVIDENNSREEVVEKYRHYLWDRIKSDPDFREQVKGLYGKDLCCCCAPKICHGDVLIKATKWLNGER